MRFPMPWRITAPLSVLIVALAGCSGSDTEPEVTAGSGATAVTNCGVAVPAGAPPTKIFAAFHNGIEAVYALGAGDKLVGAAYLDNPLLPEYAAQFHPDQQEPTYYPEEYPSREEVLRLDPDFVVSGFTGAFTTEGLGTRAELNKIGIGSYLFTQYCPTADGEGQKSLADNDVSLDSVYGDLTDLGRVLGTTTQAEALVTKMKQTVAGVESELAGVKRPTVAMLNRPGGGELRVFGSEDVATTIIEKAGGIQVFDDVPGRLARIGTEELIKRKPDVIVIPACCGADVGPDGAQGVIDGLKSDPALANVPAIRDNRIYAVTFAEITPGVRNADAVANLAKLLHPEKF
ncbi:ABC transporter substrate-binding protein [Micromonospora olivasterospora]|uniref:Iron complex transport system substrate-binding protein n=2 Tax=Micromonospora olivasterospora TaxID=1880 RepID=A0A562I867_MICOL|nr:ABC transporter substrate-binding protein [Micromonospora olivasterospora]TWH67189.1 iron complex transport system substrate-binding protein [Micromonospora olivasterospora]